MNVSTTPLRVVIVAGGTGGHLFPGQALAQELVRRHHQVMVVGDRRVEEMQKLFPSQKVYTLPSATPFRASLWKKIGAFAVLGWGLMRALWLLYRLKPSVVIGFGGYACVPCVVGASLLGIPTGVHEQNGVLGRANRFLAPRVQFIAAGFESPKYLAEAYRGKLVVTGNPVRDMVASLAGAPYSPPGEEGPIRILVFGGSQGAQVLSDVVPHVFARLPEAWKKRLEVVHQCRLEHVDQVRQLYSQEGIAAVCASFFERLPEEMARAHLVIGRSGASTVAELCVIGRPAILIPLARSLDGDQMENAKQFEALGAGWLLPEGEGLPQALWDKICLLCSQPALLIHASRNALRAGHPEAAKRLADTIEFLCQGDI